MNEADDRLAGDPVWELFPRHSVGTTPGVPRARRYERWLLVVVLVAMAGSVFPPAAVVIACAAVALPGIRMGRRLARAIPDKSGGAVCARFTYAWGAWKLGLTAFALMFVLAGIAGARGAPEPGPAFIVAPLLWMGGFLASAALTAWGLLGAYRSGMRIWVGQGVNQARTLLLGMLVTVFTVAVLGPLCLWLAGRFGQPADQRTRDLSALWGFFGAMFGGPVLILMVLDWFSRRVIADRPGKFGPKVPAVGKWNS